MSIRIASAAELLQAASFLQFFGKLSVPEVEELKFAALDALARQGSTSEARRLSCSRALKGAR